MPKTVAEHLAALGAQVRALRIDQELTQRDLADIVSVSEGVIVRLEAGRPVTMTAFVAVVRALGRADWLEGLDPLGNELSPLEQYRAAQGQPARRSRASRRH